MLESAVCAIRKEEGRSELNYAMHLTFFVNDISRKNGKGKVRRARKEEGRGRQAQQYGGTA